MHRPCVQPPNDARLDASVFGAHGTPPGTSSRFDDKIRDASPGIQLQLATILDHTSHLQPRPQNAGLDRSQGDTQPAGHLPLSHPLVIGHDQWRSHLLRQGFDHRLQASSHFFGGTHTRVRACRGQRRREFDRGTLAAIMVGNSCSGNCEKPASRLRNMALCQMR